MQIEERNIATIRPYENNPRLNDAAVDVVGPAVQDHRAGLHRLNRRPFLPGRAQ
jgi:hypothetical protein